MAVILDILGSFIVRSAIVVVILNLMINLHQSLATNTDRIYLNESINTVGAIIAADLKLAGYRYTFIKPDTITVRTPNKDFRYARRRRMAFYADTANIGRQQLIQYRTSDVPSPTNKVLLYREILNRSDESVSQRVIIARDIISFEIRYYKVDGSSPWENENVEDIKSIFISIEMISNITEKEYYATNSGKYSTGNNVTPLKVKWSQHFFPENL